MSVVKFNSVSEGIAIRLNQIAGNLSPLGLAFDPNTGQLRCQILNQISVSTVTTVTGVTNVGNLGGLNASAMTIDSMNNAWALSVRPRIS